ncbi:low molecular weight protein-tyrosine-phosphatase [Lactococcus lactis subsp. lactis]|uniref:low molecular weight protein-tyrosine-phosphatase n=1 Tax=Lactococcus lactis TaxID=1358 RepID=UPI000640311A|nr:low molecular weight protein-tyrosine-phosphatase [Lactococcus lactis]KLK95268.1 arsenate reductase (thioredoxin), arsC [Lactococcus lactis subsp. lactis]MDV4192859.1 low molecular weight protein-tyrosine-phosphatase [Lactococcus lactis subsp. lactis]
MEKIVFVCLGNICRSPMAEFVMKDLVEKAGNESNFLIESRATSSWEHGNPIHSGTQTKLKEQKIAFDLHKGSQKISSEDFYEFDKIIAMDESNLENLRKMAPEGTRQKIEMLLEQGVPDPWFTGDFQETYQLVKTGCQRLLDEIV